MTYSEATLKKRRAYDVEYRKKINPNYWKKRYLEKRDEIRAQQSAYERSPEGRAKKRAYEAKPERKAKKAEYTAEYQSRLNVHKRRLAQSRQYRKTPKGRLSAQLHNQNRRARLLSAKGSFTKDEWLKVRKVTKGVCPLCGKKVGLEKMSVDHIIPLSKGGTNEISNIRAICKNCNSAIGNRPYIYMIDKKSGKRIRVYC
ncbi:MAG: HNH endonuclease [Nanoarchaeota archaeon]|nr:HNH endonuclease [Nanoarchaeota archaeon]